MRERAHLFGSALFFLAGCASFSFLAWVRDFERGGYRAAEPYFQYPVVVFSRQALLRNDALGNGAFGVSRGVGGQRSHQGVDLLTRVGNPIFASKSGRVTYAGDDPGYGRYVEILHPDGTSTRYAHLSELGAFQGEWVSVGRPIGLSGKTGNAQNPHILPHLHFEIRENGQAADPLAGRLDPSIQLTNV